MWCAPRLYHDSDSSVSVQLQLSSERDILDYSDSSIVGSSERDTFEYSPVPGVD
jgi:hypothetical protein